MRVDKTAKIVNNRVYEDYDVQEITFVFSYKGSVTMIHISKDGH
jgi:hypothetical protein